MDWKKRNFKCNSFLWKVRLLKLFEKVNFLNENKKILEPPKWGEDLGQYSCYIEGVLFDNLTYEQYKILAPFSD